jgi:hypothetical protein
MAYGTRVMNGAMIQLHKELEEASATSGAGMWATFSRIVLPLASMPSTSAFRTRKSPPTRTMKYSSRFELNMEMNLSFPREREVLVKV